MNRFSPSDAALEGFRLTREHPSTIGAWCLFYFFGLIVIGLAMMASLGPKFMALAQRGQLMGADPEVLSQALEGSLPAFIVVLLLALLLFSVIMAGICRLVLRPEDPGTIHLKLGLDEIRLTAVNTVLVILGFIGLLLTISAVKVLASIPLLAAVVLMAFLGLTIWIGVRLSLVVPATFDQRRIDLREAWRETHRQFWPILGMLMLSSLFYLVVLLVFWVISLTLVEVAGGRAALDDIRRFTPITAIVTMLSIALQMMIQVIQIVTFYAPFAFAYRVLLKTPDQPPASPWVRADTSVPPTSGFHPFFETYDAAFARWSGTTTRSLHWSALGYWFLAWMALILFQAGFAVAGITGDSSMAGIGVTLAFLLSTPFNLMLLLSTVKRGRRSKVPGWLTALLWPALPVIALLWAFLPEQGVD